MHTPTPTFYSASCERIESLKKSKPRNPSAIMISRIYE